MSGYSGYGEEKSERRMKRTGQLIVKRILDIIVSFVALIVLFPLMSLIALAIKLDSKGPVFFRQERVGKDGKKFRIVKFRTMIEGAESMGTGIKTSPDDYRITRVGRWLRLFGFDELPQILNVLKGEMSLVGPRPTIPAQVQAYTAYQRQRLLMKPGITGLAVIRGRNALSWDERIDCDVEYVTHWSLLMDLKILALTPWNVLVRRKGVYLPQDASRGQG